MFVRFVANLRAERITNPSSVRGRGSPLFQEEGVIHILPFHQLPRRPRNWEASEHTWGLYSMQAKNINDWHLIDEMERPALPFRHGARARGSGSATGSLEEHKDPELLSLEDA